MALKEEIEEVTKGVKRKPVGAKRVHPVPDPFTKPKTVARPTVDLTRRLTQMEEAQKTTGAVRPRVASLAGLKRRPEIPELAVAPRQTPEEVVMADIAATSVRRPEIDVERLAELEAGAPTRPGEVPGIGLGAGIRKLVTGETDLEVGSGLEHLAGPAVETPPSEVIGRLTRFDLGGAGSGIAGREPGETGFMERGARRTRVEPVTVAGPEAPDVIEEPKIEAPEEKPGVGVGVVEPPRLRPPTPPRSTGNVTADLINLGLYNRRLSSYNKQVSAAQAAKRTATEFGVREKRRGRVATAQIEESAIRARTAYAGPRPKAEDFIEPVEFNAALAEWQKRYSEAPVSVGGAKKPTISEKTDYTKYK